MGAGMSKGPTVTLIPAKVVVSCEGCDYLNEEHYSFDCDGDGDSGYTGYCDHPDCGHKCLGDGYAGYKCPDWCPEKVVVKQ